MSQWYLATYQKGYFKNNHGIIKPDEQYAYKLKESMASNESPEKEDWLRIHIADKTVSQWDTTWTIDTNITGLVNNSTYWVYGRPYSYRIVTNDQTYYLKSFSNNGGGTITGTDINDSDVTIDVTTITAVTIGPSVTSIGDQAFYKCSSLASLIIPDSVETIGDNAFAQCENLTSVTIGNSVQTIGDYAFQYCYRLACVKMGDSVETIGEWAFYGCSSLASLNIPDSVTKIGYSAFAECTSLTFISVSQSVLDNLNYSVGHYSFFGSPKFSYQYDLNDSVYRYSALPALATRSWYDNTLS